MGLDKSTCLKFYKRTDIQEAIAEHAKNKEIGTQYGSGFGKRPDILIYPQEILDLAKNGLTSFHASEELWENPLELNSNLSKKELDDLRIGWDLVLDIDCPDWDYSKLITHLLIQELKEHGVTSISCKFSGNKGFHIGVPFEAFPEKASGKETKLLFPEGVKKILAYLADKIKDKFLLHLQNDGLFEAAKRLGKTPESIIVTLCEKCGEKWDLDKEQKYEFICPNPSCGERIVSEEDQDYLICPKCKTLINESRSLSKEVCKKCGHNSFRKEINLLSLLDIDTILISSRHLYRMPYSLHEKSGLVSLPINPDEVLKFTKVLASPNDLILSEFKFLDRDVEKDNARQLLLMALDFEVKINEERDYGFSSNEYEEIEIKSPIQEEFFPPCIKLILNGVDDGKKRAVFVLSNFLGKIGWNKQEIENYLLKWNKSKNIQPLRENYIKSQLKYFKPGEKLPPNCNNEAYYLDLNVCKKDGLCAKIKNPVNYTLIRWKIHLKQKEEEELLKTKEEAKQLRAEKKKEREKKKKEKLANKEQ